MRLFVGGYNWRLSVWWIMINTIPFLLFYALYHQSYVLSRDEDGAMIVWLWGYFTVFFCQSILLAFYGGTVSWWFAGLIVALCVHLGAVVTIQDSIYQIVRNYNDSLEARNLIFFVIAGCAFGGVQFVWFFRRYKWGFLWVFASIVGATMANAYFIDNYSIYHLEWRKNVDLQTSIWWRWVGMGAIYGLLYALPTSAVIGILKRPASQVLDGAEKAA